MLIIIRPSTKSVHMGQAKKGHSFQCRKEKNGQYEPAMDGMAAVDQYQVNKNEKKEKELILVEIIFISSTD